LASHKELVRRLDEMEGKVDRQSKVVFDAIRPRRHGRRDTPDGNRSPGENRPMPVPMERVGNRILSIRGHRVVLEADILMSPTRTWG
jgi:hypothetical protein